MAEPIVAREVATVYRAGGRRWFSKRSAYRAAARAWIKARCDCQTNEPVDGPNEPCKYHENPERYAALIARLASICKRDFPAAPLEEPTR